MLDVVIVAGVFAFASLWSTGANDVANSLVRRARGAGRGATTIRQMPPQR